MKTFLGVCAILSILIFGALAATGSTPAEEGKAQTLCPIMGGAIDKTAYVDYEGERVYFCCIGCKGTFLKDPQKYVDKMKSEGIVLDAAVK